MASSWSLNNWQQQQLRQKQEKSEKNPETTSLDSSMDEWMRTQPLSVLQLDVADRIVLKLADERDAIQKKTFTKWVNKHLKKAGKNIEDLFLDLQDGHNLVSLLEVLSGESLKREKGRMRIHRLQNVQTCLDFLECKNVKLVNIQAADIVDGNPKLTLGLIWIIILHYQVSEITREEESGLTAKDALTQWARRVTEGYPGVHVRDMTSSWRDGLAFNAILHKYRPDLINWREIRSRMNTRQRLDHAFGVAEHEFGVTRLLDPEDVEVHAPDERSMITYISTLYDALPDRPAAEKYDRDIGEYRSAARDFLHWVHRATRTMQDRSLPLNPVELKQLLNEMERFKAGELAPRLREKQHLEQIYIELETLFGDTDVLRAIEDDLTAAGLDRNWNQLLASISEREQLIMERMELQGNAQDAARRLNQEIGVTNEKLDTILTRIEETESRTRVTSPRQLKDVFDNIAYDLNLLEAPIEGNFRDVESLKATRHPQANEYYKQVFGLHQRRLGYLERCGVTVGQDGKFTTRTDFYVSEEYFYTRETLFKTVEESIQWVDRKLKELSEMPFVEDLKVLEENMERHKLEHRDIMDYRHRVDQCIAHQAKVSTEDSGAYCDLLHTLEEAYAQLRELSTGRVLDLDSLIAFIRAAQLELVWINEREELEVSRNWSDVSQLDLPMLQNYYKQLMHEIELREEQFNAVHNQGAALINQGHPAIYVIEAYLSTMQAQWDWLLALTQCLEIHLQDALNMQQFVEDAQNCEQWMEKQMQLITAHYDRGDFSLDEGERLLHELEEIREMLDRYHDILVSLIERSRIISPLWQRGERIGRPIPVNALCNYTERNISIRKNDECALVDNSDMIKWLVRTPEDVECVVPSVVFRIPPPDERLLVFLQRIQAQFDRLRRLWTEKQRMVRFTMILNTMRTIRAWDLKQFMALDPDQREAIINALNDDTNKLLAELDPNDPLAVRLRDELRLTNEHFYQLLQAAQRGPEPELADKFDEKIMILLQRLEEAWRNLNDRVSLPLPRDIDAWEQLILEHKTFEDSLQSLDSDVSMIQELFRQLKEPSPMQRARMDQLLGRWEDLWDLSRMFAERLKALEVVLNGLAEASQIVAEHEITLASFNTMPARLDELRAAHSQLLEIQLILQQQQPIMDDLATNVGHLRQHVVRTRFNVADHPDVDRLEDEVQRVTVRWENICMQVIERLKSAELSLQSLMIYRAAYENEVTWLDRVEATLSQLRSPENLRPEEYQEQLDILLAEYAHLNERTQAMENVNLEGGKYIRDARVYDIRLSQYKDILEEVHKGIDSLIRRTVPPPTPGADVVAKELDELNKRFAQLSSIIYQRRNDLQLLMQKYQQKQLEEEERLRAEERRRRAEEERRLSEERQRLLLEKEQREREEEDRRRRKALEDLEKERLREERERELQRLRELEDEKERLLREEAERRRRERERAAEEERKRREEEERRRLEREEAERRRREEEDWRRREREEAERRRREEEERRRLEEEQRRLGEEDRKRRDEEERKRLDEERRRLEDEARRRREKEDEERRRREKEEEDRRKQRERDDEERRQREKERERERERWEREQRELLERTRIDIPIVKETYITHISPQPKQVTVVVPEPKKAEVHLHLHREEHRRQGIPDEIVLPFDETKPAVEDVKVREHEDETDVIMYAEETEQRTKFYELEAIKNMQTGEILTFVESVRQGLLDLRSGEFFDIISGSRISLQEAVERGYISQSFNDCLQTHYGIKDPNTGEELTLFEAIQRGLYDPECRQLRDPSTGELMALYEASRLGVISMDNVHRLIKMGILKLPPLHLEQAIEQKVLDIETGQFIGRFSRERLPLREALHNGYITITSPLTPMIAITLTECIGQRFMDPNTGEFVDKNTQEKLTLRDAVSKQHNLINLNVREVVNTGERKRVTVGDAILRNIINTRQGNFTDSAQRQTLTLLEAYDQQFIQKPLTLKAVAEKDLTDSLGHFIDGGTKKRMSLLEAVAEGLLDPDAPHIIDPNDGDTINLAEALERGIVTPAGFFASPDTNEQYTIQEAHKRGLLVEPVTYTVFDVKGVKNTKTNQMISFNEAVETGAIQLSSERFIDLSTNESYMLPDTVEKGRLLDPMLHMILSALAGVKDRQGNEMTVFKAIASGVIDTKKGAFVDKQTNQHLQPKEAYEQGVITLKGAMQLAALFNVHPSLVVVGKAPKVRRKRIQAPAGEKRPLAEGEVRMTLEEAMRQGLIDARAQRFQAGDREITLQDALTQGLVDSSAEWIVPAKGVSGGPTVQESVTEQMTETSQVLAPKYQTSGQTEETVTTVKRLRTKETVAAGGAGGVAVYRAITSGRGSLEVPVEGLHIFAAEREGLFDTNTGLLTVPGSDRTLSLEEALELGILNSKQFTVRDTRTGQNLSINEAVEKGIMNQTGHVRDNKTGRTLSLQAAIDAEYVTIAPEQKTHTAPATKVIQFGAGQAVGPVMSITPIGTSLMEESELSFSFDSKTGEVVDGLTRQRISLDEAVRTGKVNRDILRVKDALTDRELSYTDAMKWGIIDKDTDCYSNKRDGRVYSLRDAAAHGWLFLTSGISEYSKDALRTDVRQQTRKIVTTKEAAIAGPAAFVDYSLQKVIELDWYDAKSGMFTHPDTRKQMSLKDAIMKGLFNPYESVVVNMRTGEQISLLDAVQSGVIDAVSGTILNEGTGERVDLKTACECGLIRSGGVAQTLEGAISSGRLDLNSGEVKSSDTSGPIPLHEAIARGIIEPSSMIVKDPSSGEEMAFLEAVRAKIVDLSQGLVINKRTGDGVGLAQAVITGIIRPVTRPGSIPLAIAAEPYAPKMRGGVSPGSKERLVDFGDKRVMVKVIKDEQGVEKGEYVDSATGMKFTVRLHGDPYATQMKTTVKSTAQVQSIELEPHAELIGIDKVRDNRTGREMSLSDAQRIGLARVSKHGKQLTKTYGVFRSDLANALKSGVIDPGTNEHVALADAIKSRLIDIHDLVYIHPQTNERIDFVQAANMGLLDVTLSDVLPKGVCNPANGERISISRAIDLRIIDPKSGGVSNPFKKEPLTWLDILKPVYASLTMEGVYDPRKGYAVPILSAFNDGLIDLRRREYHNPITDEQYSLEEASKVGLIDEATHKAITTKVIQDWRSGRQVDLLEAVQSGIVDPHHRTVTLGKGVVVPVSKAIEEGKFPQDIGQRLRRVDKLTFAEALGRGLIDVRSNQYTDPDTGRRMTVAQALQEGYIDTSGVESQEGVDDRNLSNVIDSYEFDENSGRIREQKTGLYLTFREAIERGVIDGDSLLCDVDTGRTMTLRSATNLGLINNDGKYVNRKTGAKLNLKDAVRVGLLALISSPMLASQAFAEAIKRREKEGVKFKIERPSSPTSVSPGGSRILEEVTTYRMTPRVEPTLSLKVRTEDVSDRIRSLINDPQAYADRQRDFLHRLGQKNIDVNEKVLENPASSTRISIREAVDSGLLDVVTGEVVHPSTGRRFSIPKSVHMKYIQPSAAKSVMEALNLNLEQLYQTMQGISPRSDFSPLSFGSSPASGASSGPATSTFTREVVWRGDPAELRSTGGDLSQYTTVTGTRAIDETPLVEERTVRTTDEREIRFIDDNGNGNGPVITSHVETIRRIGGPQGIPEDGTPTGAEEMESQRSPNMDEISEKYSACGDTIDGLLEKLRKSREDLVQRILGSADEVDGQAGAAGDFGSTASILKEKEKYHRDLEDEVKRSLKEADELSGSRAADLTPDEFHNLRKRSDELKRQYEEEELRLQKMMNRLTVASKLKEQFDAQSTEFHAWMKETNGSVDELLSSFVDSSNINAAQKRCRDISDDVSGHRSELDSITSLARQIQDEAKGYISQLPDEDTAGAQKDVPPLVAVKNEAEELGRAWQSLKERCQSSHHQLEDAKNFFILYSQLKSWLNGKSKLIGVMGPVSDIHLISAQLQQIQVLLDEFEGEKSNLDEFLRCGQSVSSAQPAAESKQAMTEKMDEISDKWNELIKQLNDKKAALNEQRTMLANERDMDSARNYQDSLNHLLSWLEDQEGAVGVSPSADPKVLKAQIEAQKLLQKIINDKKPNIESFKKSSENISQRASPEERDELVKHANEISERYDNLVKVAEERREKLHDALEMAEQWAEHCPPLVSWLDNVEKRLQKDYVSIDAERIASQIDDHKNLHEEIEGHRPLIDNVTDLGTQLCELVADDEKEQLQQQLVELATRYDQLGSKSERVGQDLIKVAQGLDEFLTRVDELGVWLDDASLQLETFDSFSSVSDTLEKQAEEIMRLGVEINDQQQKVSEVIDEGRELCKHTRGDEAVALQGKLDGLRWRYSELTKAVDKKLGLVQDISALADWFDQSSKSLGDWLNDVEADLANIDDATLEEKHALIENIERDLKEFRPMLNDLAVSSARLSQLCASDQAELNEAAAARTRKRFENVEDQVRRKGEQLSRLLDAREEVASNLDDLVDWFQKAEAQVLGAGAAPAEPVAARAQLQDQKLLHSDVGSQRARSREAMTAAKKLLKDMTGEEAQAIEDKIEVLKECSESVHRYSTDRLSVLEQAVPLSEHFHSSHIELGQWLDVIENELESTPSVVSGMHPEQLRKHLDNNKAVQNSIQENKPLLDSLNKSGAALSQLCNADDANFINDVMDQMNARFEIVREQTRSRGHSLDDALQQSLEVADQLDNMLDSLSITADKVRHPEPVAGHPDRIREQVQDNSALMDELEQKHDAYKNIQTSADDILRKADPADPAVSEIKGKMDTLNSLWNEILSATEERGRKLDDTLAVAQRFWDELHSCEKALKNLQQRLDGADPPACQPNAVEAQQTELTDVETALHEQAPRIDACRETGQQLLRMVGEPEKPELQHQLDGLNSAWETVTAAFHRRNDNLLEAMEKAMTFHEMLSEVTEQLAEADQRFDALEPISSNLLELQEQIEETAAFKADLDKGSVVLQQLNQQCDQLVEGRTSEQAAAIKRPMQELNQRWDQLAMGIRQRRDKLGEAYVKAGHFQQALDQVLDWIEQTNKTLDEIKPVVGDLKQIEIEIAKHKVLQNDVHSRQTSIDTLNDAGRKLLAAHADADPKGTQQKMDTLNKSWAGLLEKLADKGAELENSKSDAARFGDQVQHWLHWLADVDDFLSASKTVGGLPETTREQLENFMVVFEEMQTNQPQVEETIRLGEEYIAKSPENASSAAAQHIKMLKQRWDAAMNKAKDRKTKLEIAYSDAVEFDELMKQFVEWLVNAEQYLNGLLPVSRLMEGIQSQMEEHAEFREEVNAERAVALELNGKGTKLKYYCQKQDVILIKNLLVSTGSRWDKVASRTADRTKQLDHAYSDVREFHVLWNELGDWCVEKLKQLEEARAPGRTNKPEIIKENLALHKEFQQELGKRQRDFDTAMKQGKQLKDHAPRSEQPELQGMLDSLREKWTGLCNRSIDRQRELEEDLLFAGQFKEAVEGLMKWLTEAEPSLSADTALHGDIDTVTGLVDQHHNFLSQLKARQTVVDTVHKAGEELLRAAKNPEIETQLEELNDKWARVKALADAKEARLTDAKEEAEKFYHGAHAMLEWLSDMETKVKYAGAIPEDEEQLNKQLFELEKLQSELASQKAQLDDVLGLGKGILAKCHPDAVQPMKQWLTILQARWDEVESWAQERDGRLKEQLNALREQDALLDDLIRWLAEKDAYLHDLDTEPIPEDLPLVENLIEEHTQFEDSLRSRQPDFDEATKGRRRQDEQAVKGKDVESKKPRPKVTRGRNPKVQQVTEKFNQVWLMSLDRKRKLDEMLNYLRELRKMKDFNFDDWRRRYTAWMNNKKSRVMDFFRRQDKDGDGKVTREEFIDGILQSKFPTTRLEMNAVADIFDKDGDGYIDYREFINALRPDRDTSQPKNDSQRIKSEVQRQAQMCTCRKKYEILELGEGKYRFGEQLRLVRILRSTVMVRVGGGWVALDEFLVKNDPCRAKGRTNIELREKFILAEGVSQTMLPFKSKNPRGAASGSHASSSSDSSAAHPYHSTPGPIMKVREKTERSMPMSKKARTLALSPHQNGTGNSSADSEVSGILSNSRRSSADLLSPVTPSGPRSATGRLNGTPSSRPSSRGGSNIPAPVQTSRPPSRAGSDVSDVSLRSHDSLGPVTPSRIPSARKKKQK